MERIAEDAEKLAASSNNGGDEAGGTAQATTTPRFSFSGIGAQQTSRDAHNESKKKARMRSKMNWNRNKDSPNVDACAYEVNNCWCAMLLSSLKLMGYCIIPCYFDICRMPLIPQW